MQTKSVHPVIRSKAIEREKTLFRCFRIIIALDPKKVGQWRGA